MNAGAWLDRARPRLTAAGAARVVPDGSDIRARGHGVVRSAGSDAWSGASVASHGASRAGCPSAW